MRAKGYYALSLVLCNLILAAVACAANAENMTVQGTPLYICPSSTPRPTDVLPPPDPPTYPANFQANLNYAWVDPDRNTVNVQYLAQSVGWVQIGYSGLFQNGVVWPGSSGLQSIAYAPFNVPGFTSVYPVTLLPDVSSAQIWLTSAGGSFALSVVRYASPVPGAPVYPPCCLPGPIYPTARPAYTPYPTPTLYAIPPKNDGYYFLDDPIYTTSGVIRLRLRMQSPITEGSFPVFPIFTAATWTLQITNVGAVEFDFLGGLQTYVSEIDDHGQVRAGVWSPSHLAALFLGIVEQAYYPHAVRPGQTITVKVAAWIPAGSRVRKVSMVLDSPASGDPGYATFTPGSGKGRVATWQNAVNTICRGEIQFP